MPTADVVVVGAGVNGASTAFHLAKAGAGRVVVLDRRHLAAGASGKSGALVRMHYTNEPETRLAFESLKYFQNWGDLVGGDCGFRPVGFMIFTPPTRRGDLDANVAMQRRVGVNVQVISPEAARELDPSLDTSDVSAVAYEPESGYADPNATTYSFARAAMDRGATFQLDTPVARILTQGDRVVGVETAGERIEAPVVVVIAGAWANQLFAPLGLDFGLVPSYARVAVFRWSLERPPTHLTYIDKINHTWARPIDGSSTLIGVESRVSRYPGDPDDYVEAVTQDYIDLCREKLVCRFPSMRDSTARGNWQGLIMRSPDSRPLIGAIPRYRGLYCMAGDSGSSFKTSPAIGKCLAELITEGHATTVDLAPFRPSRFAEGQPWVDEHDYGTNLATISR